MLGVYDEEGAEEVASAAARAAEERRAAPKGIADYFSGYCEEADMCACHATALHGLAWLAFLAASICIATCRQHAVDYMVESCQLPYVRGVHSPFACAQVPANPRQVL